MKHLFYLVLIILCPSMLLAQNECYEHVRFSPTSYLNRLAIDHENQVFYQGGSALVPCSNAVIISSDKNGVIDTFWPSLQDVDRSYLQSLDYNEGHIAAVGIMSEALDYESDADGSYFSLFNTNTGEEEQLLLLNKNTVGTYQPCPSLFETIQTKLRVVAVGDNKYWINSFCKKLLVVGPSIDQGYRVIESFNGEITGLSRINDSLVAVATQSEVLFFNSRTEELLEGRNYRFRNLDSDLLMSANDEGELFLIDDNKLRRIFPREETIMDLNHRYTNLEMSGQDAYLVIKENNLYRIDKYVDGAIKTIYSPPHQFRSIEGVHPYRDGYLYWGKDGYGALVPRSNDFYSIQSELTEDCEYNKDLSLVSLEMSDIEYKTGINSHLTDLFELKVTYKLKATIVNNGTAVEFFSLVSYTQGHGYCPNYYGLSRVHEGLFSTSDTIVISNIIGSKNFSKNFEEGDSTVRFDIDIKECLGVGTPDHKIDVFIEDNTLCEEYHDTPSFVLTSTEDVSLEANSAVHISPNPAWKRVRIELSGRDRMKEMKIFNFNGQLVGQYDMNAERDFEFDRDNLAEGVYFIRIKTIEGRVLNQKLVLAGEEYK